MSAVSIQALCSLSFGVNSIMHQLHWKFPQKTPSSTWEVNNIPDGAEGAVITHIITDDGRVLQPENQVHAPYGLQISFGVQEVSGIAYGDYYLKDETHVEQAGNVVNITMNSGLRD